MKLQQLLQRYQFDDLMPVVADMFPGTGKFRAALEQGYNILMSLQPVASKKNISYRIMPDPNSDASLWVPKMLLSTPHGRFVWGKEVVKEKGVDLTDIELAANCLVNVCLIGRHPKAFDEAYRALSKA